MWVVLISAALEFCTCHTVHFLLLLRLRVVGACWVARRRIHGHAVAKAKRGTCGLLVYLTHTDKSASVQIPLALSPESISGIVSTGKRVRLTTI